MENGRQKMEKQYMEITAIFFDLGEVVLTNDWLMKNIEKDREFYGHYAITPDGYMRGRDLYSKLLMTGSMTEHDYWINVLHAAGATDTDPAYAIELSRHYQEEKPGMFRLLQSLCDATYPLGVISDTHREIFEWKRRHFELDRFFTTYTTSCDVGVKKPDIKIFQSACDVLHVEPRGAIFIDDTQSLVEGAALFGFHAIRYIDAPTLRIQLRDCGIQI
jgi:putative hydrolase of the HAD superfamily